MASVLDFPAPSSPAPDLTALAAELCLREYHQHAREQILWYARNLGTLECCPYVDPEDRADLDAILESAWPAVAEGSAAWDAYDDSWAAVLDERDDEPGIAPGGLELFVPDEADEAWWAAWSAAREAELEAFALEF